MAKSFNKGTKVKEFDFTALNGLLDEFSTTGTIAEDEDLNVEQIPTGIYMLNAVFSGSIYGGIPSNRVIGIGGESGCLYPDEKILIYRMKTQKSNHSIFHEQVQTE